MKFLVITILAVLSAMSSNAVARNLQVEWGFDRFGGPQCYVVAIDGREVANKVTVDLGFCDPEAVETEVRYSKKKEDARYCVAVKINGEPVKGSWNRLPNWFCDKN